MAEKNREEVLGAQGKNRVHVPPRDIFIRDARTIARAMASNTVSPKGIGSGIRMIQYFINRGGKSLPAARKRQLEKAKKMRQERLGK
jgi:hypothetical protein